MQEWEDMVGNSSIRLKTAYGKDSKEIDFYNRVVNGDDGSKQFQFTKYFETKTQFESWEKDPYPVIRKRTFSSRFSFKRKNTFRNQG